jgi:carboxypeptidase family protein
MEPRSGYRNRKAVPARTRWVSLLLTALMTTILSVAARPAAAQFVSTSSVEGTVTDETGGTLPGVAVILTSPALQVPQLDGVTDSTGRYRFPQLPAGVYHLRFELSGFQSLIRSDLQVGVGFAARVDAKMSIGSLKGTSPAS